MNQVHYSTNPVCCATNPGCKSRTGLVQFALFCSAFPCGLEGLLYYIPFTDWAYNDTLEYLD